MKPVTCTPDGPPTDLVADVSALSPAFRRISTLNSRARQPGDSLPCFYR
ncbi:hypothetical protein D083_2130 [Dickeya solani RNS 08.23.3.1.A]|nr:hypothetical protein D083_2130 [Dickeya solani RNS 08.23.3.1.A]